VKVLIMGVTGSAGASVLQVSLAAPGIDGVRAIARRPLGIEHAKLRTFVHQEYLNYAGVTDAFAGVDACFFCLGIAVSLVSGETEYRKITHDFAVAAAQALKLHSPQAVFYFLSGQGASLKSPFMWARVKAETERDLMARFSATCWRPAYIDSPPSHSTPRHYRLVRPIFRLLKPIRSVYVTGEDIGRAMIQAESENIGSRIVENAEIRAFADRYRTDK
jgi:uncharacterized protein YbjT (DUF2867 family)